MHGLLCIKCMHIKIHKWWIKDACIKMLKWCIIVHANKNAQMKHQNACIKMHKCYTKMHA